MFDLTERELEDRFLQDWAALQEARHRDPFSVLGRHENEGAAEVRVFIPSASSVALRFADDPATVQPMRECAPGFYVLSSSRPDPYRLVIEWPGGVWETDDPYRFGPQLSALDMHLFAEGRHLKLADRLGANPWTVDGVEGALFAVWAPSAHNVSVVGDFNSWDERRHPMRLRHEAGIWELFIPGLRPGDIYNYAIRTSTGERLAWKADPLARQAEMPPKTGSVIAPRPDFAWNDSAWMAQRKVADPQSTPISIYEVHVESWLRTDTDRFVGWDEASYRLIPYVKMLGFTHIELMPIAEYPFGGSWGYQPLSLFALTARMGDAASFARFVDRAHEAGLGVILDWVPAHFPSDAHGLARFDGTALYEHEDPRQGFHHDWNTLIYNFGRHEVRGFLLASALWWLETFHLDGLRVDAVASMLYRDYSRPRDAWIPNANGGRENLEAVAFLQELNELVEERAPGALVMAEESTAWPGVTRPVSEHGLGFTFKWNMGWMHDTLDFFSRDPVHRAHHIEEITFGLHYGFSEAFILPLSHDEVVHGKKSLLGRMPGDSWQRFANLRLLLSLMWTHPGKKLLFMGGEFGAEAEWNVDHPFPWPTSDDRLRNGLRRMVGDLNALYLRHPQLHRLDCVPDGFAWIVSRDTENTVFAFRRSDGQLERDLVVILNATPVPRHSYLVGVQMPGEWREVFNSDSEAYGGSNLGNHGIITAESEPVHGQQTALSLSLPPLGLLILEPTGSADS